MTAGVKKHEHEWLKEFAEVQPQGRYTYLDFNFIGEAWFTIKCNACDNVWVQRASSHRKGHGCPVCAGSIGGSHRKPIEKWLKEFAEIQPEGKYKYLKSYRQGKYCWFTIECLDCGTIFEQRAGHHRKGHGCPLCNRSQGKDDEPSQGHLLVREALEVLGFVRSDKPFVEGIKHLPKIFYEEAEFEGCRNVQSLPFDFYIPSLDCLIEYQGSHHYRYVEYFHGDLRGWEDQQKRDLIKKEFAERNFEHFFRIPYTVDRLDLIVDGLIERLEL